MFPQLMIKIFTKVSDAVQTSNN